jgi:hypothetical protein
MIEITFADGVYGKFNFENYFDYLGYYQFLNDLTLFLKINVHPLGHYAYWVNDDSQEVEIDSAILYAICENKPIIVNDKIIFDPSRGKEAWM